MDPPRRIVAISIVLLKNFRIIGMMKFWSNENSSASMLHDSIFSRKVCKKSQRGQTAPPELLYSQMHLSFFCKDYDLKGPILQLFFF
jgi:hypothetical protein